MQIIILPSFVRYHRLRGLIRTAGQYQESRTLKIVCCSQPYNIRNTVTKMKLAIEKNNQHVTEN